MSASTVPSCSLSTSRARCYHCDTPAAGLFICPHCSDRRPDRRHLCGECLLVPQTCLFCNREVDPADYQRVLVASSSSRSNGRAALASDLPELPEPCGRYLVAISFPALAIYYQKNIMPEAKLAELEEARLTIGGEETWVFQRRYTGTLLRWALDADNIELAIISGSMADHELSLVARELLRPVSRDSDWQEAEGEHGTLEQFPGGPRVHLFGSDNVEAAAGGSCKHVPPLMARLQQFDERNIIIVDWRKNNSGHYIQGRSNMLVVNPYIQDIFGTWAWDVDADSELELLRQYLEQLARAQPRDVQAFLGQNPFGS